MKTNNLFIMKNLLPKIIVALLATWILIPMEMRGQRAQSVRVTRISVPEKVTNGVDSNLNVVDLIKGGRAENEYKSVDAALFTFPILQIKKPAKRISHTLQARYDRVVISFRGRYFSGTRSRMVFTKSQYLPTLGMWQRSLGVCGERSVGPKLTRSICGRRAPMTPHSRPA